VIAMVVSMTIIVAAERQNHAAIVYAHGFEENEVPVHGYQSI
jgi:hypothetical protein